METEYGIVSDLHGNYELLSDIDGFDDVDSIIISGDIVDFGKTKLDMMLSINMLLEYDKDLFFIPGCSEEHFQYKERIEQLTDAFDKVHDMSDDYILSRKDHDLVFLPGSDVDMDYKSYRVVNSKEDISFYEVVPDSLTDYVRRPEKSVLVSHLPPKFVGEDCIDYGEYGEALTDIIGKYKNTDRKRIQSNRYIKEGTIFPTNIANVLKGFGYPVEIKKENQGSDIIRKFIDEVGISKGVCGHFHQNGKKANNSRGEPLKEGKYYTDIFYNPGVGANGQFGIVTIDAEKMKYKQTH